MTYQQVNLYQTVIEGTSPGLSASVLFRLCGLVVITLLLIWGRALWNTWAIRGELASLQEQRAEEQEKLSSLQQRSASWTEEDNKLSARVEGLTKEIIAKQKLLNAMAVIWGSTEGFSPYLTGLARQPMPEIWLKRIVIADSGRQLVLNGSTISPEKVPELLQKLADEEVFAGREFNSFSLTLADPDSRVVDFNISTADAEAKGS
jgi:hypothetical protein